MTKGFNINRFKPGTFVLRIRPANSGDRSFIMWPSKLISIEKKVFTIWTEELSGDDKRVKLNLRNFKQGWIKYDDLENPKLEIPAEVIEEMRNKRYYHAEDAIARHNRKWYLKSFLERQVPYKERDKYKQRHGIK